MSGFRAIPLALPILATVALGPEAAPQRGGEKAVLAAVVDGSGVPFKELPLDAWSVREDDQPRPIVLARPTGRPLQVVVLVDATRATRNSITDVRTGVLSFVRVLQAGSETSLAIVSVAGAAVTLTDFDKAGADLDRVVQRLFPDQTESGVMLEAIADAAKKLAKSATPRRVIVALSLDGHPEGSSLRPQEVANAVFGSGASLWAVSYRNETSSLVSTTAGNQFQSGSSSPAGANTGQNREIILTNLTVQSGGARLTVTTPSAIETSLKQIAGVLLSQYEVVYVRPDGPAPKQLQMSVARSGAHVLAQRLPPR